MKLDKLLDKVGELVKTEDGKSKKRREKLRGLIDELEKKERKLMKKLESGKGDIKRSRLQKELEIVREQLKKAAAALKNTG